ncbi:MAG: gliding motility-associated C-terminal domain-containing protein [Bacteroidetes bacterium]|nr:gliding motility-associated C-terminal domain-containing protein [Bacteroidota bacterium]
MRLLPIIFALFFSTCLRAQQSEGCVFLKGDFVEIGVAPNGAFGTPANAPAGYHSRPTPILSALYNPVTGTFQSRNQALGFVADFGKDGWDNGNPTFFGDYFMPGAVQEGFSIQVNGVKSNAWSNNYQTAGGTGFSGGSLLGSNTGFISTAGEQKAVWEGNMSTLYLRQTIALKTTKSYFTANIFLKNTGTDTLRKIYYMRTVDPDNEVSVTNSYTTHNKIAYQLPNAYNKTLVTANGMVYPTQSYLGLGTKDCQARCFYHGSSLFADASLESIYDGTFGYVYADSAISDVAIGLVFKIGDLAPGDSTSFSYAYILNAADLDEAFTETEPGIFYNGNYYTSGSVIVAPTGTVLPLSIVNGSYYNWTWSPATFLNTTTGPNVNATVSTGPVLYTMSGVGAGVVASRCSNRTLNITISPYPVVPPPSVFSSQTYYCINQTPSALAASGPGIIRWYTSAVGGIGSFTAPTPSTAIPGTFIWYVTQEISGVESVRIPVTVIVKDPPVINFLPASPEVCLGDSVQLIAAGSPAVHTWSPSSTLSASVGDTVKASPPFTSTYMVTATDSARCAITKPITVVVRPKPVFTITPDAASICKGDSIRLTAGGAPLVFTWDPAPTINTLNGPVVIVKPITNTSYIVTGTDANGCTDTMQSTITVLPLPLPDLGPDKGICRGNTVVLSPGNYSSYLWQDGSVLPTFSTGAIGEYWVLVTDAAGCKAKDTIRLPSILELPARFLPGDMSFCRGNQLVIKAPAYSQYLWSDGTTTPKITITKFGTYTLTVTDQFGCAGKDTIVVFDARCIPFAVPTAFTPDQDGKNDLFRPIITQIVKGYKMNIYNRWGQLLYETNNYQAGWDGQLNGIKQAAGVYVYQISFTDADGQPVQLKGTFTLIR